MVISLVRWVIAKAVRNTVVKETNMKLSPRQIANRIDEIIGRTQDESTVLLLKDLKGLVLQQEEANLLKEEQ